MSARCPHDLADPRMCSDCRLKARQTAPTAPIMRATEELVALAVQVRPDWSEEHVRADLAHATTVGITWEQQLVQLPRLMVDPIARSRDLIPIHQRGDQAIDLAEMHERTARGSGYARSLMIERDPIGGEG